MGIEEIINQYFPKSSNISFEEYKGGATNLTYILKEEINGQNKYYKLQKMNSIFNVSLMEDIEFITEYLFSKNIQTVRVVKTLDNNNFVKDESSWWRMLTYIPGRIFDVMPSAEHAKKAGALVGLFHTALSDCDYKFKFKLPNYHNVDFDLKKLESTLEENKNADKYIQLRDIGEDVLNSYKKITKNSSLPKRIIHNDLKVTNILFDEAGTKAIALIDLDTLTYGTIDIELGDALRSWCMEGGEDTEDVQFNLNIYNSALKGYFSVINITKEEKNSIPHGVKLLTLELAARFIVDAFNENYFILNSSKYKNLYEQNKKRAENQFEFFQKFSIKF